MNKANRSFIEGIDAKLSTVDFILSSDSRLDNLFSSLTTAGLSTLLLVSSAIISAYSAWSSSLVIERESDESDS